MRRLIWMPQEGNGWPCIHSPTTERKQTVIKALWDCVAMTGMLFVAVLTTLIVGL